MKKMLVLFLILFTTVLADSEEGKYVDLLSDEEKQQFLEKVARRILKDVESQEDVSNVKSGELNEEQLKQHTEYVRSVLKEEQENIRRSKGDGEEEGKSASGEKVLGVQPLASLKVSLFNERQDLTLRNAKEDTASDKDSINNITIEVVTDNAPIIKRSVQDDNENKSAKSDETTSEILNRVTQTNITSEALIEVEADNEGTENGEHPTDVKVSSEKGSEVVESTYASVFSDDVGTGKSVTDKSGLSESVAHNVSVKGIHEGSRRANDEGIVLPENTTESTTVSAAVAANSTENKSDEYNNVSSADEEFTTVTYPFEVTSAKANDTESTITDDPLLEMTTDIPKNVEKDSEPIFKSRNDTINETEIETEITKSARTSTSNDQETQNHTLSVLEPTTSVPDMTVSVVETTASDPETTPSVPKTTASVPETTALVSETTNNAEVVTTDAVTESTTVIDTTEQTTKSTVPILTTKETKIVVEDFTSAPTTSKTDKSNTFNKPKNSIKIKMKIKNPTTLLQEVTTVAQETDDESIEVTTKRTIKNIITVHKPSKYIVGPKAKKISEADNNAVQHKHFIDLGKVYFNNKKVGKAYHVFEIPADVSPFIKAKEPIAEQPYYVPIYNYSPNNAYFNPKNRLGPNPEDSSTENIVNDDDVNEIDRIETLNVKMEYDGKFDSIRKKFAGKQKLNQVVHKPPLKFKKPVKNQEKVNPEDYLDSDYYFGRVRKEVQRQGNAEIFNHFPNSDENDHPAHSIQQGNLKDHVRAVRNILFQQKSFGLLEKDKYDDSIEEALRLGHKLSKHKQVLRKGLYDDSETTEDNESDDKDIDKEKYISIVDGKEKPTIVTDIKQDELTNSHIQKIGYLKDQNDTKTLYIIDDGFKANVEQYIKEKGLTPVTLLTEKVRKASVLDKNDEIITLLRKEEKKNKEEKNTIIKRAKNAAPNQLYIPINTIERPSEKTIDFKLNVRRNQVVKVGVNLQILEDMVTQDSKALVQYDWLGTTVDIQASLQKLFELTSLVANENDVHPADMEILKYVLFLHKVATETIEANDFGTKIRKELALSRKRKKKSKAYLKKEKRLINKVWLYLRKQVPEVDEDGALKNLNKFLMNIEDGVFDLHDAIKNIAKITKYKNQRWYQNLKDLYIDTDEKHLLELLLHMTTLRLFTLIEESAKNGLEDDYIQYMKKNRKHCKSTLEEMLFVMEILDKYEKFVE